MRRHTPSAPPAEHEADGETVQDSNAPEGGGEEEQPGFTAPGPAEIVSLPGSESKFYCHTVVSTDDVTSLAMHYGTLPSVIKQFNPRARVFNHLDHMIGQKLYIPVDPSTTDIPAINPADEKKRSEYFAVLAFLEGAAEKTSEPVARFYLGEHNWNLTIALRAYHADLNWEQSEEGKRAKQQAADATASLVLSLSRARIGPEPSAPPATEEDAEPGHAGTEEHAADSVSVLNRRKAAKYADTHGGNDELEPLVVER